MSKKWNRIVIHHSASGWGSALSINGWHKERGWTGIGYHYVILNGYANAKDLKQENRNELLAGMVETGRLLDADQWVDWNEIGAHALGFNHDSIGICLIHKTKPYHPRMISSLIDLVCYLCKKYDIPHSCVVGHYELNADKPHCPDIDMEAFRKILSHTKDFT